MRFHLGSPLEKPGFPDATWKQAPSVGPVMIQIVAIPVAVLFAWLTGMAWCYGTTAMESGMLWWNIPGLLLWGCVFLGIPAHETVHGLAHPRGGLGPEFYFCFWPSKLLPYVQYMEPISRRRRLFVVLLPFLVMTVLPLLIALALAHNSGHFALWYNRHTDAVAVVSISNAALSSGDLLGVLGLLTSIPAGAQVLTSGDALYWKVP